MSALKNALGANSYWQVNKHLAKMLQSLNATVLLSELIDLDYFYEIKEQRLSRDGKMYFFATAESLEDKTALSYKEQKTAIEVLQAFQLVETRIMGIPAKLYFTLSEDHILHLLKANIDEREKLDLRFDTNSNTKNKRIKRKYQKESKEESKSVVTDTPPLSQTQNNSKDESFETSNNDNFETSNVNSEKNQKKTNSGGGAAQNSQPNVSNSNKPKKPVRGWFKLSSLTEEQKDKIRKLSREFDSPAVFGESLRQWLEYKEAGEINFRNQKINPYKNFETMLKEVTSEANKCKGQSEVFKQAVQHSIDKLYLGLFPEKFITQTQPVKNGNYNKQQQGNVQPTIIFKTGC